LSVVSGVRRGNAGEAIPSWRGLLPWAEIPQDVPVQRSLFIVTGGAGFIGAHLVERLLAAGDRVVVIDDLSTGTAGNLEAVARHPDLRVITGKVSECAELPALAREAAGIFHLAAAVGVELVIHSPIRTITTNLDETRAVLDAAIPAGTPVLLASTSEVYGKSSKEEFAEEDDLLIGPPTLGRWSYACSKLMDEFLALACLRERGLPVVIVRLFNTVGPRQTGRYGMVLPRFVESALAGRPLRVHGDGTQTRCFCHVADTVTALQTLLACPAARGEVVNVGNDASISIAALARRVIERTDSKSAVEIVPYSEAYGPGFEDMRHRRPRLEKLARLSGFRPRRDLDEIIDAIVAEQRRAR
jgi:UDP-glucose 4-epimerase